MSQPRVFSPDCRNVGGRHQILRQMLSHQNSLQMMQKHQKHPVQSISFQSAAKNDFKLREHLKNVFASQQRIRAPVSLEQRKKNKYDYLVYPSLFFRRVDKRRLNNSHNVKTNHQQSSEFKETLFEIDWEKVGKQLPKLKPGEEEEFKQQISKILIKNRIFQDDDYAFVICLLSSNNMHVDQRQILTLFQQVIS